jgi:hypothetical protein
MIASPGRLPGQVDQQRPLPNLEVAVAVDGTSRRQSSMFATLSPPFRLMDAPSQGTGA